MSSPNPPGTQIRFQETDPGQEWRVWTITPEGPMIDEAYYTDRRLAEEDRDHRRHHGKPAPR